MLGFLLFILIFCLLLVLFAVSFVFNFIRNLFYFGRKTQSSPSSNQDGSYTSNKAHKPKIFEKDDGEYVDFEEID
jgi:Domain of unknown function (DUF4834)